MSSKLDFNKNMSRYLSARKRWRPSYSSVFSFRISRPNVVVNESGVLHSEEATIRKRFSDWYSQKFSKPQEDAETLYVEEGLEVEPVEQPFESVQIEEYEQDSKPKGFFSRMASLFSRETPVPEVEAIENVHVDDMKNDLKYIASNFVGIMEQMGHRNRERVKNTEEFAEIKEIFKKHSIIK